MGYVRSTQSNKLNKAKIWFVGVHIFTPMIKSSSSLIEVFVRANSELLKGFYSNTIQIFFLQLNCIFMETYLWFLNCKEWKWNRDKWIGFLCHRWPEFLEERPPLSRQDKIRDVQKRTNESLSIITKIYCLFYLLGDIFSKSFSLISLIFFDQLIKF